MKMVMRMGMKMMHSDVLMLLLIDCRVVRFMHCEGHIGYGFCTRPSMTLYL